MADETSLSIQVVNMAGCEVLKTKLNSSANVRQLRLAVSKAKDHPACCINLVLATLILQDHECLAELSTQGDSLQISASLAPVPKAAGVYAAWDCNILVLRPDGGVFFGWYDSYWSILYGSLKEVDICQRSPAEWMAKASSGKWAMNKDDGTIQGFAIESAYGIGWDLSFEAKIVNSDTGLHNGISTTTLETRGHYASQGWGRHRPHEFDMGHTYYLVSQLPDSGESCFGASNFQQVQQARVRSLQRRIRARARARARRARAHACAVADENDSDWYQSDDLDESSWYWYVSSFRIHNLEQSALLHHQKHDKEKQRISRQQKQLRKQQHRRWEQRIQRTRVRRCARNVFSCATGAHDACDCAIVESLLLAE